MPGAGFARRITVTGAACVVLWTGGPTHADQEPPPWNACDATARAPETQAHLLCLYRVGAQQQRMADVRDRLTQMGAGTPGHPWPTLVLGYATQEQDESRARDLYERAATDFAVVGDAEGEVLARHNLRNIHFRQGRAEVAARQVARARTVADASGLPLVIARAAVLEATHTVQTGGDMEVAYRVLSRARALAFPSGPLGLRRTILLALANASFYLGRFDDAVEALEAHRALQREDGSTIDAATVAFNLLNTRLTIAEQRPTPGVRDRLLTEATTVLADVTQLGRPSLMAQTHRVLADLTRVSNPAAARVHIDRCLALEATLGHPELRAGCLWTRAWLDTRRSPRAANRASLDAIAALASTPESPLLAYAWQARLRLVWDVLPEADAITESLRALDAIEQLRARQTGEAGRAALFTQWVRDYAWLAGRLLDAATPRVADAFAVGERLRARVLLDRVGTRTTEGAAGVPAFAALADVQSALDEDEAMLWYALAPREDVYGEFGGGSWLIVVTRTAARVQAIDPGVDLQARAAALTGLLRARTPDDRWRRAAHRLGPPLLGEALPPHIRHLVVVADGDLHALAFEGVLAEATGDTLGERYAITMAPSATIWTQLRARLRARRQTTGSALVLADPALDGATRHAHALNDLPGARDEARAVASRLGLSSTDVRFGTTAREDAVAAASAQPLALLHLAAHARADARSPDQSAVFLAPGGRGDGTLQPTEIAAMTLGGALVVLSACESAGGVVLAGEGTMSLARAFFAGGAGAVVATRWPLRDDDAAWVMGQFYEYLSSGHGTAESLRRTRVDARAQGLPPEAWAGLVVIGDGRRGLVLDRTGESHAAPRTLLAGGAAVLGLAWLAWHQRRARR